MMHNLEVMNGKAFILSGLCMHVMDVPYLKVCINSLINGTILNRVLICSFFLYDGGVHPGQSVLRKETKDSPLKGTSLLDLSNVH